MENKTKERNINCILREDNGGVAFIQNVPDTLETWQAFVEGFIEIIRLDHNVVAVVNDEGAINGMHYNFTLWPGTPRETLLFGPVVFVGEYDGPDGGEFRSLSAEQIMYVMNKILSED